MLNREPETTEYTRYIFEHVTDGIFQLDNHWRFIYVNSEAQHLIQKPRKEIIGKIIWDILDRECLPVMRKQLNKAKSQQTNVKFEYYYKALKRWCDIRVYPYTEGLLFFALDITSKKQDEQALKESEGKFKTFAETTKAAIFIAQGTKIIYANPHAELLSGYSLSELKQMNFWEFVHPDFKELVKKRGLARQRSEKVLPRYELKIITKDGKERWVDFSGATIELQGKPTVIGTAFDITERKKFEIALKENEERYRSVVETATEGIVSIDANERIISWNKAAQKIFSYNKSEILGEPITLIIPKQLRRAHKKGIERVLFNGKPKVIGKTIEVTGLKKDGNEIPIELSLSKWKSKEKIYFTGIIRDISERKKIEEDLKFKSMLLDSATDSILVHDYGGRLSYINESAYKNLDYTKEELMNIPVGELNPPEYAKEIPKILESIKKRGSLVFETVHIKKDKSMLPVEVHAKTLKSGKEELIAGIVRNIAERKKTEEKLQHAYETEHKIASTLQKSLLPIDIPVIKNLEIKFYYQSASQWAEVGGDFYDVFETVAGTYGIAVGDVSGKGIDAAAETAKVKYLLRDRALTGISPNEVLFSINNALFKQKGRPFTALTYSTYNPKTAVLTISNAGNPYPYFIKDDDFIKITGVPISIISKEAYPSKEIKMAKGDAVLIYTDGLVEPRRNGDLFGEERLRLFVKKNKNLPAKQLLKELVEKVRKFSNYQLKDDILIVYLRRRA